MTTKVQKWGNSYAVRLPKAIVETFGIRNNTFVEFITEHRGILIRPKKRKTNLDDYVSKITPLNRHKLIDWGLPKGKEVW